MRVASSSLRSRSVLGWSAPQRLVRGARARYLDGEQGGCILARQAAHRGEERRIEWIHVDDLRFDPQNPRLPSAVDTTTQGILRWFLLDATIVDLMRAIGEQGYFPGEPLLVVPDDKGKFIVVEGNRRFAAVMLLRKPDLATEKQREVNEAARGARVAAPNELPALKFAARDDIVLYLGYRHVTGIKEWDPLAKARYLSQLVAGEPTPKKLAALAKSIGSRADYVGRVLTALRVFDRVGRTGFLERELSEATLRFAVFSTALSYESIAKFIGLKSSGDYQLQHLKRENAEKVLRWLFKPLPETGVPRIPESRKIRAFSRIVASRPAMRAFEAGRSLDEAELLTGAPSEAFGKTLASARDKLDGALRQAPSVEAFESVHEDVLKDISQMSSFLLTTVRERISRS